MDGPQAANGVFNVVVLWPFSSARTAIDFRGMACLLEACEIKKLRLLRRRGEM